MTTTTTTKNFFPALLLVLVLSVGALVRVAHFPHIPPGFNQDEAASAYEAFALAETGNDKWGNHLPAYFPGWGSGQNVLLAYLTVPAIKLLGLTVFAARLPSLVLGLLTLPLLYFCLRPLGRRVALVGTLLLAVVPWHFMLSRWSLESNLVPFFMLLGCTALSRALLTRRRRWIVPSLVPFALSLYAYGTTIAVLPFLLLALVGLNFRRLRAQWGSWLLAAGLFVVVAFPFLVFFLENYVAHQNFAWTDALPFATPLLPATRISQVSAASWTATLHHNLGFMAAGFDDGSCYNVLPGFRPFLSGVLPLGTAGLLLGAYRGYRRQFFASPQGVVVMVFLLWALASLPLLFAFELNVNRFNHFYLPLLVLAAWALDGLVRSFKPQVPRTVRWLGLLSWLTLDAGLAIDHYFTAYRDGPIKDQFNAGLEEAFAAAKGWPTVGQVRITGQMPLPYVYTLFFLRYPPAQFRREVDFRTENGSYNVRRFGKYVFADEYLDHHQAYGYLARKNELADNAQQHREILYANDAWEVGIMHPAAP